MIAPAAGRSGPWRLALGCALALLAPAAAQAQFCGVLRQHASPNPIGDTLGYAVAADGEWALAGDPVDGLSVPHDVVAVYRRDAGGPQAWGRVQTLTQPGAFGSSIALSGSTALLGAPIDSPQGTTVAGSAWFYERSSVTQQWQPARQVFASPPVAFDQFGIAAALDGDTAALAALSGVSVRGRDVGGAGQWGEWVKRVPGITSTSGQIAVALYGDRLAVGVPDESKVVVYGRDQGGANAWGEVATIAPPGVGLGSVVSLWGDRLAVRSYSAGVDDVRLFRRDAGGPDAWGEVKRIPAPAGRAEFGAGISLRGSQLVVFGQGTAGPGVLRYVESQGGAGAWGLVDVLIPPPPVNPAFRFFWDSNPLAQTHELILLGDPTYSQLDAEFYANGAAIFFTSSCFEAVGVVPGLGPLGAAVLAASLARWARRRGRLRALRPSAGA